MIATCPLICNAILAPELNPIINETSGVIATCYLLLFSSHSFSQIRDSIPAFGQVNKAELLLKECDFDKNAEAFVLFDVEDVVYKEYAYSVNSDTKASSH